MSETISVLNLTLVDAKIRASDKDLPVCTTYATMVDLNLNLMFCFIR